MDQANMTLLPGPMHPPNVGNARRGRNNRHGALHGNQSERLSLGEEAKLVGLTDISVLFSYTKNSGIKSQLTFLDFMICQKMLQKI